MTTCGNADCDHDLTQHVKSGPSKGRCLASDRLGFSICRCNKFEWTCQKCGKVVDPGPDWTGGSLWCSLECSDS